MKSRDIIGKRIARVEQERVQRSDTGDPQGWAIKRIVFTDGTSLGFGVIELGHDYAVEGVVWKAKP